MITEGFTRSSYKKQNYHPYSCFETPAQLEKQQGPAGQRNSCLKGGSIPASTCCSHSSLMADLDLDPGN